MKHHIYYENGALYLVQGLVPEKPHSFSPTDYDEEYYTAIADLKKSAVLVGNPDYALIGASVQDNFPKKEGELYPIECEVKIENRVNIEQHPDDKDRMRNSSGSYQVATIHPIAPQSAHEEQDELWEECFQYVLKNPWEPMHLLNFMKSKFLIQRKP